MRTEHAPTIHRADYAPLAWTVARIDLHFALAPQATVVTSRLACVRNPDAAPGPIVLDGEELETLALTVDGLDPAPGTVRRTESRIEIDVADRDEVALEIVTRINPQANTALSGLYLSRGGYFTQCEAEGFRRITWFPDRPDVMARFTVTLEGDKAACPVLLSNGNLVEEGELPDGRHYARWEDPFPKPCYLFALVAADLVALERRELTASGREVLLQVWVEKGNLDRAGHAMESLVHAMRWDEETFGLELDLDRFMIVAVSDFNMGAMENKGLNIFNAKYVLAKPDTATDVDYEHIESVVAHEYFHNWTGNRVTCRDWFQLTLKEGLTVFRDQQFSADMLACAAGAEGGSSARAVKRIDDVRVLRSAQFPEDAGPMAHPIRPESYQEINNFYTATVYEKGAEVIRMLHTLLGPEGFRNGMDLYFSYHDGQAVTCDDFVNAMAEANGRDLDQFMRWYGQAGTPRLRAQGEWNGADGSYTLTLSQSTQPTPGQPDKLPLVIPVAVGLIGPDGADLPLQLEGEHQPGATTRVLELATETRQWRFTNLAAEPAPSLLRGFSAPVILELDEDDGRLAFRMAHDSDACNRWDAAQRYAERVLLQLAADAAAGRALKVPAPFIDAFGKLLRNELLDPAFRAQALALPGEAYLLERMEPADPAALRAAQLHVGAELGRVLAADWLALAESLVEPGEYRYHPADAGGRALVNLALRYLCAARVDAGVALAAARFDSATNMTDRFGALAALMHGAVPAAEAALAAFYRRYQNDTLVLDKWFALQAGAWRRDAAAAPVLAQVRELLADPAFSPSNPNKVYALLGSFFRANPGEFHLADGSGYEFWAEQVIALDAANPQVAARMARALENWRRFTPALQAAIRPQLERVLAADGLSPDVTEIVEKALAA
ncbi:aminopeptidase N [Pseudothauera rhizosphaerae]|uniref:Aminopeptidase N n=1 Tax=Pseudothauera rhizosphaerae TaxID=2565932 RepID=A0A4V3W9I8_9RHOO|nr:aminopeptidase N [Pseudothauera rhizosphaerae]THF55389.1 aminopeptidase N [Pseudothauera rhizosphaerae]